MTRWAAQCALLLCFTSPLYSQHAEGSPQLAGSSEERCVLCHGAHFAGQAPYLLKSDDSSVLNVARVDAVSRSCLRCHWTVSLRDQQPEFVVPADPIDGLYLGPVPGDDHPMGMQGGGGFGGASDPVECMSCHEPHAPGADVIPDPVEQMILCTLCHEPVMPAPTEHTTLACTDCHQLHNAGSNLLRDTSADPTCLACHAVVPPFQIQLLPAGGADLSP